MDGLLRGQAVQHDPLSALAARSNSDASPSPSGPSAASVAASLAGGPGSSSWDGSAGGGAARRNPDVPAGPEGLRLLALQGAWRAVLERTRPPPPLAGGAGVPPSDEDLERTAYQVLALAKLRQWGGVADALGLLGDLDAPGLQLDTPQGRVSRVPFALRWIAAELPAWQGQPGAAADGLARLLELCSDQLAAAVAAPEGGAEEEGKPPTPGTVRRIHHRRSWSLGLGLPDRHALPSMPSISGALAGDLVAGEGANPGAALWARRQQMTALALANLHLRSKEYVLALKWLSWLLAARPGDPDLLSHIGCVQLMLGDTAAAEATFSDAERAAGDQALAAPPGGELGAMLRRNRGLLLFAQSDYAGAIAQFDAVLRERPGDSISANNRALAHMYLGRLPTGIAGLEASLRALPLDYLSEPLMRNIMSMYELSGSAASAAAKSRLAAWALRAAPDDFDNTCLRTAAG